MFGTKKLNYWLAFISFFLTFCASIINNLLVTALLRSVFAFILFFLVGYLARWVISYFFIDRISGDRKNEDGEIQKPVHEMQSERHTYQAIDKNDQDFKPWNLNIGDREENHQINVTTDDLVRAIRSLSDE